MKTQILPCQAPLCLAHTSQPKPHSITDAYINSMRKRLLLIILFFPAFIYSQPTKELRVGDTLPNVKLEIINAKAAQTSLADFKSKLLIIDFWATWCSPCITLMPKMDSLQKVFANEIKILPVTYESRAKVENMLRKNPRLKGITLPIAVNEQALHNSFPHRELPHYVWVNAVGAVIAITGSDAVTAANIRTALQSQALLAEVKAEKVVNYNKQVPLFQQNAFTQPTVYRVLTGYTDGLPPGDDVIRANGVHGGRLISRNVPLPWLWQLAYSEGVRYIGYNRMVFEVQEPAKLLNKNSGAAYDAWLKAGNGFCYEVVVPPHMAGQQYKLMQDDLRQYFPQYQVTLEKRDQPCLALMRTSGVDKLNTKGGEPAYNIDAVGVTLQNKPLSTLVVHLNAQYLQKLTTPVVDETNYTGKVDLTLQADLTNPASIRTALKPYNLDLIEKTCPLEMLLIRDTTP